MTRIAWLATLVESVSPLIERLGWTLLHSVWQFALVSLVLMCLLRIMQRASAAARYLVCAAALAAVMVLPAVTLPWITSSAVEDPASAAAETAWAPAAHGPSPTLPSEGVPVAAVPSFPPLPAVQPILAESAPASSHAAADALPLAEPNGQEPALGVASAVDHWLRGAAATVRPYLQAIVAGWLAGVAIFLVRPLIACHWVRRLRRNGLTPLAPGMAAQLQRLVERMGLRRSVAIVQSSLVDVPAVIGCWRPIVLLPASVLSGLTMRELEAIVAHELAHVRRHDYLVNAIQIAVETIYFYHPAAWWISHQMRLLREDCCDDLALKECGNRVEYVRSLLALDELRGRVPQGAVAANGGSLLARVRRIVGAQRQGGSGLTSGLLQLVALIPLAALLALLMVPLAAGQDGDSKQRGNLLTILDSRGEPAQAGTRLSLAQVGYSADVESLPSWVVGKSGRVELEGLEDGQHRIVAQANHVNATPFAIELPLAEEAEPLRLHPMKTGQNDGKTRPRITVEVHGEGLAQYLEWKFDFTQANEGALQYDLTPSDLQLIGNSLLARVLPGQPLYYQGRFVRPGDTYSVHFTWIDLVQSGLWYSRASEAIAEPEIPVPPGKAAFRSIGGEAVIVESPQSFMKIIEQRKQATAEIEFEKKSFFLGENLLTHFGITNHSEEPLMIDFGGDYRGSMRHLRFKVAAFDVQGNRVADPTPNPVDMGGLSHSPEIKPGATYWMSLPLQRYCEIREPGTYEVKIYHDLGWDPHWLGTGGDENRLPDEGHVAPIASARITIRQPNARQARQVWEEMIGLPRDAWTTGTGVKSKPYADFGAVNFPVYVPLLKEAAERAASGDATEPSDQSRHAEPPPAVEAMGATPAPEATRALIELLGSAEERVASAALDQLLRRLPYPYLGEREDVGSHYLRMKKLAETNWREEFRPELLEYATNVLRHGNASENENNLGDDHRANRLRAAMIMQAVGRRTDYDALSELATVALASIADNPVEQASYPRPATLADNLADALWYSLCDGRPHFPESDLRWVGNRLKLSDENGVSPGVDPFSYMRLIQEHKSFRPPQWKEHVATLLLSPYPVVRAHTLNHLPKPWADNWYAAVEEIFRTAGDNVLLNVAALNAVERNPSRRLLPAVRESLDATDSWIKPAAEAAYKACLALEQEQSQGEPADAEAAGGKLSGRILVPQRLVQRPLTRLMGVGVNGEAGLTGQIIDLESFEIGPNGGLANVLVFLRGGNAKLESVREVANRVEIVATEKGFAPRLVALLQGQSLAIRNDMDSTTNALLESSTGQNQRNQMIPAGDTVIFPMRAEPLPISLMSNIHEHLRARVFVHTNPYFAVTGADGSFTIEGIPAGEWEVAFWHARTGWLETELAPSGKLKVEIASKDRTLGEIRVTADAFPTVAAKEERPAEPAEARSAADPWFWPDPYGHLGFHDAGGDGWHYLRMAGDERVASDAGIPPATRAKVAKLFQDAQEALRQRGLKQREEGDISNKDWARIQTEVYQAHADKARELLTDQQHGRIMQLFYQRLSYDALARDEVAAHCDLSQQQREEVDRAIKAHRARLESYDTDMRQRIERLQGAEGLAMRRQIDELKVASDARGPAGRRSHKQVWTDFYRILSPGQRELFNKLRGPMPEAVRATLHQFE